MKTSSRSLTAMWLVICVQVSECVSVCMYLHAGHKAVLLSFVKQPVDYTEL